MEPTSNFFYGKEYHKIWEESQCGLKRLIHLEDDLQAAGDIEEWRIEYEILGHLYLKYVTAVNKLNECYDQIVQPQKRILIRKLLDCCMCRFLEIKHRMVQLNMNDIDFFDSTCVSEKIVPFDGEINIPTYYARESKYERKNMKFMLEKFLRKLKVPEETESPEPMTIVKAILIIQKMEKARQALKKYDHYQMLLRLRELGKYPSLVQDDGDILTKSATVIQKVWRGYKCRKSYQKRKTDSMVLMGMVPPLVYDNSAQKANHEIRIARHQLQRQREARFAQVKPGDRPRQILRKRRRMLTVVRNKDREWYSNNVLFRKRASFVAFDTDHPPATKRIEEKQGEPRFTPKKPKAEDVKKQKRRAKKKEDEPKKDEKKKNKDVGPLERPILRRQLIWESQEYKREWQGKDESLNFPQIHVLSPTMRRNYSNLKREVRKTMDDLMLLELKRLQDVVKEYHSMRRKKRKGGKKKKGGKKRKGGKKKNGGKKKKGKGDMTADRTLESLMEEMVASGIIKGFPEVRLESFTGELSLYAQRAEELGKPVSPSLADTRKLIKEYCIIPLGSAFVHANAPFVKSLMITGPQGSGKHHLLHAICTELGAFLFDISNETIAEHYPDKASLKYLFHLVNKMSRLLQPSIILFDNAERAFVKKIPKSDTSNPRRLNKLLPKITKGIKANDRIMLIGISRRPFDAKQRGLNKTYQKFLYIPRPNYATLSLHWNDLLYEYKRLNIQFDYHTMAKLSDGFSLAPVSNVIKQVLTSTRLLTVKYKGVTPQEYFSHLMNETAIYSSEETAFLKWLSKCPMAKKKQKYLKKLEEKLMGNKEKKK